MCLPVMFCRRMFISFLLDFNFIIFSADAPDIFGVGVADVGISPTKYHTNIW